VRDVTHATSARDLATPAPGPGISPPAVLELRGIRKSFGVVRAVDGVDLAFRPGEVHALVGENGAGKSTVIQIASGVFRPDAGEMLLGGRPVRFSAPVEAEAAGISVVYQELSLVPDLDVAENIYLHREPRRARLFLDNARLHSQCRALLGELGIDIDPQARVSALSVAQRQLVEIAKALSRPADLVIFDEPTASLTSVEEEHLFAVICRLREARRAVVYVSHRLDEIFAITDVVSVLKDGRLVRTAPTASLDRRELVSLMVGRELAEDLYPPRRPAPDRSVPPLMRVSGATSPGRIADISLAVWAGEIVGLAGLIGSGRTSLLRAIFGADEGASRDLHVGEASVGRSPRAAIAAGIAFVTEDRKLEGLAIDLTGLANLESTTLPARGVYDRRAAREVAVRSAEEVRLDPGAIDKRARSLSGGNQQKVVLGKWLAVQPRILLCDEPTRGVDVGAKAEIYRLLRGLADSGVGVLLASSELPEVLGMCDRILVLREGRLVAELDGAVATEELIMQDAAMGAETAGVVVGAPPAGDAGAPPGDGGGPSGPPLPTSQPGPSRAGEG
jgi:rhamnose transport system ATP-binding protein